MRDNKNKVGMNKSNKRSKSKRNRSKKVLLRNLR